MYWYNKKINKKIAAKLGLVPNLQLLSNFDDEKFFTNEEKCSIILLELTQNKFFQIKFKLFFNLNLKNSKKKIFIWREII